ncbi:MAG: hypothetical protein Q9198_010702 [Flavoplaca austrocitrina]
MVAPQTSPKLRTNAQVESRDDKTRSSGFDGLKDDPRRGRRGGREDAEEAEANDHNREPSKMNRTVSPKLSYQFAPGSGKRNEE